MLLLVSWSRRHQVSFHLAVTTTTFIHILLINICPKVKVGTASTNSWICTGFGLTYIIRSEPWKQNSSVEV
jgi:hypothetical protein